MTPRDYLRIRLEGDYPFVPPPQEETNGENPELPPPDPDDFDHYPDGDPDPLLSVRRSAQADLFAVAPEDRIRELETEVRRLTDRLDVLGRVPEPGEACALCSRKVPYPKKIDREKFALRLAEIEKEFGGPGLARSTDPETSLAAALRDRKIDREFVYWLVRRAGPRGMTREEIADATGLDTSEFSPRLSELKGLGYLVPDGKRRGRKRLQTVYVADVFFGGEGA